MSVVAANTTSVRKAKNVFIAVQGHNGLHLMRVPACLLGDGSYGTVYSLFYKNTLVCQDKDRNKLRRLAYSLRKVQINNEPN